jgi:aspartate aminotransferase
VAAALGLTKRLGLLFAPEDILLTRGAFGALELALETVVDPGDEVMFVSPPWFFYEALILHVEGKIYSEQTLERLAAVLQATSQRNSRTIYLISDEAYSRILFTAGSL